jgi:hypothetical protein
VAVRPVILGGRIGRLAGLATADIRAIARRVWEFLPAPVVMDLHLDGPSGR